MFVSLEKLRLCKADEEGIFTKLKNRITEHLMSSVEANQEKKSEKYMGHKINDRVWVYINDKPHAGQIKYIGRVPGFDDFLAGIEMVGTILFIFLWEEILKYYCNLLCQNCSLCDIAA